MIDFLGYIPAAVFLTVGLCGFVAVLVWLALDTEETARRSRQ